MSNAIVYDGDVPIIKIDCGENISTATGKKIKVKRANGTTFEITSVSVVDSNYLQGQCASGDIAGPGRYVAHPYMTIGSWTGHGDADYFVVKSIYEV